MISIRIKVKKFSDQEIINMISNYYKTNYPLGIDQDIYDCIRLGCRLTSYQRGYLERVFIGIFNRSGKAMEGFAYE